MPDLHTPEAPQAAAPQASPALIWRLRLTWAGLLAERVARALWPVLALLLAGWAALAFGLHTHAPLRAVQGALAVYGLGLAAALFWGLRGLSWPHPAEARARLDATLPGRPLETLADTQAVGQDDPATRAVWAAHRARMAARAAKARAVPPDLRLARHDPLALRYAALLAATVALVFAGPGRSPDMGALMGPGSEAAAAMGPTWEGWVTPPPYTGKPTLYLADITGPTLQAPEGSTVELRLYGQPGLLSVQQGVHPEAEAGAAPSPEAMRAAFPITQPGRIAIEGPGGREWEVAPIADTPPVIALDGTPPDVEADGQMSLGYRSRDDYGVVGGAAEIVLDLPAVARRHGLGPAPDARAPLVLDLPLTLTGDRRDFEEALVENLSQHPWAGLPVRITLSAEDAAGQTGLSAPEALVLPGRRFFDPLAAALAEQRRDLLWARENGRRVAQILRAVSHDPDEIFRSAPAYLRLRTVIRTLEAGLPGGLAPELQEEVAAELWELALLIEEGDLSDALERLRRAQDKLAQAMREGASEAEIADLMQEMREAMQDYMRQLAEAAPEAGEEMANAMPEGQEITGNQIEELLQRLEELMQQGRMDEAQALLDRLAQMMENMRVTRGENGQASPGQQAMEGLSDTLRDQQRLSDEAFQGLQREGEQPGQGQQGQQGQGQMGQQPGQGQPGGQPGQQGNGQGMPGGQAQGNGQGGMAGPGTAPGQEPGQEPGAGDLGEQLADRQRALRQELERQERALPGLGGAEGEAARDALGRAGRAMDEAAEALEGNNLPGALDRQAEAIDALRDAIRGMGRALAEQQGQSPGQGQAMNGPTGPGAARDPLGREAGAEGRLGTGDALLGEGGAERARDLLDEIRRRSGEQSRPEDERDYLRRLLDRF